MESPAIPQAYPVLTWIVVTGVFNYKQKPWLPCSPHGKFLVAKLFSAKCGKIDFPTTVASTFYIPFPIYIF